MKFADVDGERREATISGQRGLCPGCGSVVVAKCGSKKVNHWAHLSGKDCDSWHESETEWHRAWKNQFPVEWQEKDFVDPKTGEHHRADVHTDYGLTIEFQHSPIEPQEAKSREHFYGSQGEMIWVVDGTRVKNIWKQFYKNRTLLFRDKEKLPDDSFTCRAPEKLFPQEWIEHPAPIFFDFVGNQNEQELPEEKCALVCLFPRRDSPDLLVRLISRFNFVALCTSGEISRWLSLKYEPYISPPKILNRSPQPLKTETTQPTSNIITHVINGRIYIVTPGTPKRKLPRF